MKYTVGKNKEDNYPLVVDDDWTGFVATLAEMAVEEIIGKNKEECKSKANGITACAFSHDGRRLKANATAASFFWLDCEEGTDHELAKAVDGLGSMGLEAVVYTSAGHKPPADRFRIMVPLATPIADHADYRRICLQLQRSLGVAIDMGKLTMYAVLYRPARYNSAAENLFIHLRGEILSTEQWLSICPPPPLQAPLVPMVPLDATSLPSGYVQAALNGEIKRIQAAVPSRRHDTILSAAIRLAELVKAGVMDWCIAQQVITEQGVAAVGESRRSEVEGILRYAWTNSAPRQIKEQNNNIAALRAKARLRRKELSYV